MTIWNRWQHHRAWPADSRPTVVAELPWSADGSDVRCESERVKDNAKVLVLNNSNHGVFWSIQTFSRQRVKETSADETENNWLLRKKKTRRWKCPKSGKSYSEGGVVKRVKRGWVTRWPLGNDCWILQHRVGKWAKEKVGLLGRIKTQFEISVHECEVVSMLYVLSKVPSAAVRDVILYVTGLGFYQRHLTNKKRATDLRVYGRVWWQMAQHENWGQKRSHGRGIEL